MVYRGDFHTVRRIFTYGLLWIVSACELGLTADRISFERKNFGTWDAYTALLLAAAVLTVVWVPFAFGMLFHERFSSRFGVHHELVGAWILWLLWLVGAAGFTNTILPGMNYCDQSSSLCQKATAILAFAWTGWSLLTILVILALISQAAGGGGLFYGPRTEKGAPRAAV